MERTNWDSLRGTWKAVLSLSFVLLLEGSGLSGSCSVAKLYPTCCDPMDCSTPGFPVLPHLLEFAQTHLHWVDDAIQHLILCCPLLLLSSIFSNIRVFSMSRLFTSGGWSIGASASASVLPMTTQDWFPLGLTGLISFLSKGLSEVFSSTTVQKRQFLGAQPSLWSNSHICTWLLEKTTPWLWELLTSCLPIPMPGNNQWYLKRLEPERLQTRL